METKKGQWRENVEKNKIEEKSRESRGKIYGKSKYNRRNMEGRGENVAEKWRENKEKWQEMRKNFVKYRNTKTNKKGYFPNSFFT